MKKTGASMEGIALVSGGKDSIYAMYIALQQGIDIKKIVNIIPEEFSFMYHFPNTHIVKLISEAVQIDLDQYKISDDPDELKNILKNYEEKVIVSGAIESEYQKTRLERISTELNKIHYSPLWRKDPFLLLNDLLLSNFKAIFVSVSAEGLDEKFLGLEIDNGIINKLKFLKEKYGIHPSGEGGEYETLVLDCPIFKKRIKILKSEILKNGNYGILEIYDAKLDEKNK
ncbi:MAG: diphthine--ammonia ligase [Thermoplasmata archaeon]